MIRQPGVLGWETRRRLIGLTSALSASALDTAAVGTWFALAATETRSSVTALAGLGVLLVGATVRIAVFESLGDGQPVRFPPTRVATATSLAGCWVGWLLVAELVGGVAGVLVAGALLSVALSAQFTLERRLYRRPSVDRAVDAFGPPVLTAIGASLLLASARLVDWSARLATVGVGESVLFPEVGGFVVGVGCFATCSFLAQKRRVTRQLSA